MNIIVHRMEKKCIMYICNKVSPSTVIVEKEKNQNPLGLHLRCPLRQDGCRQIHRSNFGNSLSFIFCEMTNWANMTGLGSDFQFKATDLLHIKILESGALFEWDSLY